MNSFNAVFIINDFFKFLNEYRPFLIIHYTKSNNRFMHVYLPNESTKTKRHNKFQKRIGLSCSFECLPMVNLSTTNIRK